MVKVCELEFPKGSYKGQETAGYYMTQQTKDNIDVLVRNIKKDMQFVGLISGNGTVRNGKSTIAQQIGKYYSSQLGLPFTNDNICFKAEKLQEIAFEVPQYSCIILDEGDDLTEHTFSSMMRAIKRFFRKNGQLNLFVILILPEFFELPRPIATNRSNFLINVKFHGEFERGYYDFYGPYAKKQLYLKGKKELNYTPKGVNKDFQGRFVNLYTVNEEEYRRRKKEDMLEDNEDDHKPKAVSVVRQQLYRIYGMLYDTKKFTHEEMAHYFGVHERTGREYYKKYKELKPVLLAKRQEVKNN